MPKVSVIIPVYKVERYVRRCLDSVMSQTLTDWEAICVDDGSPDNSGKILDEYARRDKRIRVIHKENGGVSAARNDGIKLARGQYVIFIDSDDFIHPQLFEITTCLADKNNADTVSFRFDARAQRGMRRLLRSGLDTADFVPKSLAHVYNPACVTGVVTDNLLGYSTERNHSFGLFRIRHCYPWLHLMRRKFISGMKFDTSIKIAEDFIWWTEILMRRPHSVILRLPLYYYVPNMGSALNGATSRKVFENISRATAAAYLYAKKHSDATQLKTWSREFLWPFFIIVMRAARGFSGGMDAARVYFNKMHLDCALDFAYGMRARKYRRRILKLIGQK